ncbi:MAG: ribonuclease HI [Treponema sp.]|jgi:ribonuclease HI|nr:ribonuclease HI [Treponema sp.]
MDIHIYTDGGCSGNPGPGGWAYIILRNQGGAAPEEVLVEKYGGEKNTTNNRMELKAALSALEMLPKLNFAPSRVVVHTDSQYVQKGMTQWLRNWKLKNWRTSDKQPVKNQDLWIKLDELAARFPLEWKWVRGHAGNRYNERCDALTQKAIARQA